MPGLSNKDGPKTEARASLNSPQAPACSPVTKSLRILVPDDNALNRKLLRLLLEAEAHTVLEGEDGFAALAKGIAVGHRSLNQR
jgi:PleD family two-component response regulator